MIVNKVHFSFWNAEAAHTLVGRPVEQSTLRCVVAVKWYPRSEVNYLKLLNTFAYADCFYY